MRLDQPVGAQAADEERARQHPEGLGTGSVAQHGRARSVTRVGLCGGRRGGMGRNFAERSQADVGGAVAHQPEHQQRQRRAGGQHRQHGYAPAHMFDQPGCHRQEGQLPGGRAGRQDADHQPRRALNQRWRPRPPAPARSARTRRPASGPTPQTAATARSTRWPAPCRRQSAPARRRPRCARRSGPSTSPRTAPSIRTAQTEGQDR